MGAKFGKVYAGASARKMRSREANLTAAA